MNYNTRQLIAQLIYSLYRALRPPAFRLVVVDNGSSDGSAELLSAVAAAGLCQLISNPDNRYEVAATQDQTNRYYQWATTHYEPHFALEAGAPAAYAAFQAAFARDVPILDPANLIQACR